MPGKLVGADPRSEMVKRANSDEAYVLALCDTLIGVPSKRQHRFDFLRGDPGRSGKCRRLPVDAYYPTLELVIEYRETQHRAEVKHFDKPHRLTISGVHRGEQRRIYDQRRRDMLPRHGITLVEIESTQLLADSRGRLRRDPQHDLMALTQLLILKDLALTGVHLHCHELSSRVQ